MSGSIKTEGAANPRLEALLSERRSWLLSRAQHLCRTRADAEDLVQETFMRFLAAFGQASPLPSDAHCASWLISTMTNCFYDQLRRQRTRERGAADPALGMESQAAPEPGSAYERVSDAQLRQAVQSLSPKVRGAMELHVQGRKYREIAGILGVPAGTVAKRLHLAREQLHRLLVPLLRGGDS